ncbi:MAG: energy transducer TonB [Geobacteraceae bacterium]|nr:energy transducer TonB [Geobacteraceae bacterium]
MTSGGKAAVLSIILHGVFLGSMYAVGSTFAQPGKPVVIDFTLIDSGGVAPARKETAAKQPAAPMKRRCAEVREKKVVNNVETPRAASVSIRQPALETEGPVAVAAKRHEALPEKVSTATLDNSGKQGTAAPIRTASVAPAGAGKNSSGEQARAGYSREHYAYIKELIEKHLSYPPRARKMGWTGRVVVCFQVLKNGRVDKIWIKDGSGHEILDRNVVDTIREVEPFPQPPEWVELSMPIIYRLD